MCTEIHLTAQSSPRRQLWLHTGPCTLLQVYTESININTNKTGGLIMPYLPANQAQYLLAWTHEACCQLVQVYGPFSSNHQSPQPLQCQAHSVLTQLTSCSSCAVQTHTHKPLCQPTHLSNPLNYGPLQPVASVSMCQHPGCSSQPPASLTADQTHLHRNSLTA